MRRSRRPLCIRFYTRFRDASEPLSPPPTVCNAIRRRIAFAFSSEQGKDLVRQFPQDLWPCTPRDCQVVAVARELDGIEVLAILPVESWQCPYSFYVIHTGVSHHMWAVPGSHRCLPRNSPRGRASTHTYIQDQVSYGTGCPSCINAEIPDRSDTQTLRRVQVVLWPPSN